MRYVNRRAWESRLVVTPAKRPGRDPTRLRTVGRQFAVDNLRALTEIMGASDITSVLTNGGKCW